MALRNHSFFWFVCFCSALILSYSETDTLKQGHQLNDGEYLISAGKVFTLGFFSPKEQKAVGYFTPESTQNRYIGIWYTYDEDKKPVWVANRDNPIFKESGALEIDRNGNLRIVHKYLTEIVLSFNRGSTKTVAVLTDNGNFVLWQLSSDGSASEKVLWQSFDHPTDTLLPGMRLGFNLKTGQNWSISSWVNSQVPAIGPFTLGADPNGINQLIMWRRGKIHWCSGIWNDSKFGNLNDDLYSFEYVSNKNERYFTLSLVNNWHIKFPMYQINGEGVISKLDFYRLGDIELFMSGLVDCRVQTLGCVKQKMPGCRSTKYRLFERSKGYVISEGFKYEERNYIVGMDDCEAKCLSNCSCVAYAAIYSNGTGCQFWSDITHLVVDEYKFVDSAYRELYVQKEYNLRVMPQQLFWWIWFIIGTTGFFLLLSFAWLGMHFRSSLLKFIDCILQSFCILGNILQQALKNFLLWLNDHVQRSLDPGSAEMEEMLSSDEVGSSVGNSADLRMKRKRKLKVGKKKHGMQVFCFKSMVQATNNFSSSNKLGQGGYGIVYKGILEDGQEVAIKRLSTTSKQGRLEFMNEVKLVANLQHTNLVKLIGCCIEQGEKMVVYEYLQNKSLDRFIFDSSRKSLLDWKKRFSIIEGIAQGLLYLHKFSRLKIIHRDLKAGNILLDQDMNPKISDFGMAKLFEPNGLRTNAKRVVGTFGYMPPEYAKGGSFSFKTDVFSFGVLLLEIISSKKCNASYCLDREMNLVGFAWEMWTENRSSELIDQALIISGRDYAEAMKCIHVGLLCVQELPTDRPTMSNVVAMISNEANNELPKPKKPAFYTGNDLQQVHQEHDLEQGSLNDVSISEMEAR